MKHVKRIASLVLALVMVLALSVGAFAAVVNEGSITIDNAIAGQTYTIYEILCLESYNKDANAYSYKATTAWKDFVESTDIKDVYLITNDQGYVTWNAEKNTDGDYAAFAKLAQAYAQKNSIGNQGSKEAESTTVVFDHLDLGYYLVDSTLGTLCSLDTTNPNATIKEKNEAPTNVKQVEEDSTGTLGSKNDADIGQMVKFVSTVTIPAGTATLVYHDKMSAGLTLVEGEEGKTGLTVYTDAALKDVLPDGNYNVTAKNLEDGCTFEVDFADYLTWAAEEDTTLYIVYYATVNENAVVGGNGNPNESWLSYGDDNKTTSTPSTTTTYTWEIDVYKYTMVKTAGSEAETEKALAGAQFVLYKMVGDVKNYAIVNADNQITGWTVNAYDSAESEKASVITTPDSGEFSITGLDSDTYYLEEIVAPAGYNTLSEPVTVVINDKGEVTYNGTSTGTVKVLNQTGAELPSTGGMGTTVFYILGSVLVLGAAVVLVTRKRMKEHN